MGKTWLNAILSNVVFLHLQDKKSSFAPHNSAAITETPLLNHSLDCLFSLFDYSFVLSSNNADVSQIKEEMSLKSQF